MKPAPNGTKELSPARTGTPSHAAFAWIGVVEHWVKWEIRSSPVGTTDATEPLPNPQPLCPQPQVHKTQNILVRLIPDC
jgi:hypothetical protein